MTVTPQSEKLISLNSVSRGCVNVTILIYFTLNYPLKNSHPTSGQKIQIFITFYLVSKYLSETYPCPHIYGFCVGNRW